MIKKYRSERGDTIVEVLIAVAVVSLVLTSAYMLSNRNRQNMQSIKEQAQAQKLVEQQIEMLRLTDADNIPTSGCLSEVNVSATGAGCKKVDGGAEYTVSITGIDTKTYRASAEWDKLGGGKSTVSMSYYYAEQK